MRNLSPKEVAETIGVSESSVKRWCDKGTIEFSRTDGGHRRISVEDVLEFINRKNFKILKPEILEVNGFDVSLASSKEVVEEFVRELLAANETKCRRILLGQFMAGVSISKIGDEVIAKSFEEIGNRWRSGQIDIFQERQSCEITLNIIRELSLKIPPRPENAPVALGATSSGDHYSLPTKLVEMTFSSQGWKAMSLGCNLPFDSIIAAAKKFEPKVIWVSVSTMENEEEFIRGYQRLVNHTRDRASIVVGGRGLKEHVRKQLEFASFSDTLQQLQQFLKTLNRFNAGASDDPSEQLQPQTQSQPATESNNSSMQLNQYSR